MALHSRRLKYWGFTYHLPEQGDDLGPPQVLPAVDWDEFGPDLERGIISLEITKTSGSLHWQGALQFNRPKSLRQMRSMEFHDGTANFKPKQGSVKQFFNYCRKEHPDSVAYNDGSHLAGPWYHPAESEFTNLEKHGQQGRRTDVEDLAASVKRGATDAELADAHGVAYIKYHRGAKELRRALTLEPTRNVDKIDVIVLYGPSGTGKTHWARQHYPQGPDVLWKSDQSPWYHGYNGQRTLVLNDFDDSFMSLGTFKRLVDTAPYSVQTKGACHNCLFTRFIITTNHHPSSWWKKTRYKPGSKELRGVEWGQASPVYNRIDTINYFGEVYVHPVARVHNDQSPEEDIYVEGPELVEPFN